MSTTRSVSLLSFSAPPAPSRRMACATSSQRTKHRTRPRTVLLSVSLILHGVHAVPPGPACRAALNEWCMNSTNCPLTNPGGCAENQQMYALFDVGGHLTDQRTPAWRCYAADNTDSAAHTQYTGGTCYCTRKADLAARLCACDSSSCTPTPAPPPPLPLANETSLVFDSKVTPPGTPDGLSVTCYRIPMVVQVPSAAGTNHAGVIVAFAEGRIGSCNDCVVNGIVMRRSVDGGRSWGNYSWAVPPTKTDASGRDGMDIGGNPSAVWDSDRNVLLLQFVRGLRNRKTQAQTCNPALSNWQQQSSDGGLTWSSPVEISAFLGPWAGSLVGPANGIQLHNTAAHRGRLVWCGHWGVYNSTQVWYSDDGGQTYTLSRTVFPYMDECALAELSDGSVYLNMRNNHRNASCDCRATATSTDGGESFADMRYDAALVSPVCQATLSTASPGGGAPPQLLFANPASAHSRNQGTIKKSFDGGKSWARSLSVTPPGLSVAAGGSYDYSCLVPDALLDSSSGRAGGLLWSHLDTTGVGQTGCNRNPAPPGCWLTLFSRFPLDF